MRLRQTGCALTLTAPPQTPESIAAARAYQAEERAKAYKQRDQLMFLHFVDQYGINELKTWLRNVEADLSGVRPPSPGLMSDPRR